jgi:hypothetical protein
MEFLGWAWWLVAGILGLAWTIFWFLVSGWVSTLLQIGLLVASIYVVKYGWTRAPAEIWRKTRTFTGFFVNWLRAREPSPATVSPAPTVQIVRIKEFGDVNISTLLSLALVAGLLLVTIL